MMMMNQLVEAVAPPPTVSERLMEVVAKLCPVATARYRKTGGAWGDPEPTDGTPDNPHTDARGARFHPLVAAPYKISVIGDARMVQVQTEDGDVIGGIGKTTAAAVSRLRKKVGLDREESDA